MSQQVYRTPKIEFNWQAAITNTTPLPRTAAPGRPEATHLVERMLDIAADELDIDPVEIRRRTSSRPTRSRTRPHRRDVRLRRVREAARQPCSSTRATTSCAPSRRRAASATTRSCSASASSSLRRDHRAGRPVPGVGQGRDRGRRHVLAYVGTSSHGQGHETAFSMIVSDVLGVPMEQITILQSDTEADPAGWWHRRLALAADRRQRGEGRERRGADAGEATRRAPVRGEPRRHRRSATAVSRSRACPRAPVVGRPRERGEGRRAPAREHGSAPRARARPSTPGSSSFPFGAHIAVVEIDRETGRVELLRHVAVDDCGRIVNPLLVKGQQHGGIAQGVAQVLYEARAVRRGRQPGHRQPHGLRDAVGRRAPVVRGRTTPRRRARSTRSARRASASRRRSVRRPPCTTPIVDALSHLGVRHLDMPCTAERVWRAIQDADARDMSRDRIRDTDAAARRSRSTARSSAHCYDGLPERGVRPARRSGRRASPSRRVSSPRRARARTRTRRR